MFMSHYVCSQVKVNRNISVKKREDGTHTPDKGPTAKETKGQLAMATILRVP